MNDYTCKCPGPFGNARYTVMDAARMQFRCQRCNSQLVPAEPVSMSEMKRPEQLDDLSQVAPGVSDGDDPVQKLLSRERDIIRRREAGEFEGMDTDTKPKESRKERREREKRENQMSLEEVQRQLSENDSENDDGGTDRESEKPPTVNDIREKLNLDPVPDGDISPNLINKWINPNAPKFVGRIPDIRIDYSNGLEYSFDWSEVEPRFKDKLENFVESWTARRNARLDFHARGRRWILNAELVAGIDYRD